MKRWIPLLIFKKKFISKEKPKNIVIFAFTSMLESFALFYGDFCVDLYSVDINEAMKRWSVKRFINSIFKYR